LEISLSARSSRRRWTLDFPLPTLNFNEVPYAMNETIAKNRVAGVRAIAPAYVFILALAFGVSAAFGSRSLAASLGDGAPIATQVTWGVASGLTFSIPIVTAILRMPIFLRLREHSIARSRMIDLRGLNPVWISLFAGIGEELLFRGAIQPLLGLWLTSVIFALVHIQPSQYRSMTAGAIWYAGFVFFVSLLLGSIYTHWGLISVMAFHTTGDLVGLFTLRHLSQAALLDDAIAEAAAEPAGSAFTKD